MYDMNPGEAAMAAFKIDIEIVHSAKKKHI